MQLRLLALAISLTLTACSRAPSVTPHGREALPDRLSAWGVVTRQGDALRLSEGVTPYDLNTPLFSDYAHKLRTVWLPPGSQAGIGEDDAVEFPVGTIISKTFYYPSGKQAGEVVKSPPESGGESLDLKQFHLVETRLLIRREDGWQAIPYVWNAEQTDAELALAGDTQTLTLIDGANRQSFAYEVPDANQCAGCHASNHTTRAIRPIGPKLRHLNRDYAYTGVTENQLAHWQKLGWLGELPTPLPRNAVWNDPATGDLEARARSYLDINCGHCHNPHGAADTSGLFLNKATTEMHRLGVCKAPVAAGRGSGTFDFDVVPGKPDESILSFRLGSTDPGIAMPELGRALAHTEGLELIKQWIASLPGECHR